MAEACAHACVRACALRIYTIARTQCVHACACLHCVRAIVCVHACVSTHTFARTQAIGQILNRITIRATHSVHARNASTRMHCTHTHAVTHTCVHAHNRTHAMQARACMQALRACDFLRVLYCKHCTYLLTRCTFTFSYLNHAWCSQHTWPNFRPRGVRSTRGRIFGHVVSAAHVAEFSATIPNSCILLAARKTKYVQVHIHASYLNHAWFSQHLSEFRTTIPPPELDHEGLCIQHTLESTLSCRRPLGGVTSHISAPLHASSFASENSAPRRKRPLCSRYTVVHVYWWDLQASEAK